VIAGAVDNSGQELAAAGAELLLELELEVDLDEESELDEVDVLELDESEDDDEPFDSLLAEPFDEPLLAAALDASRLSLR
jgi:hypothetical protein